MGISARISALNSSIVMREEPVKRGVSHVGPAGQRKRSISGRIGFQELSNAPLVGSVILEAADLGRLKFDLFSDLRQFNFEAAEVARQPHGACQQAAVGVRWRKLRTMRMTVAGSE